MGHLQRLPNSSRRHLSYRPRQRRSAGEDKDLSRESGPVRFQFPINFNASYTLYRLRIKLVKQCKTLN